MEDRPLLLFPRHLNISKAPGFGGPDNTHYPSSSRQVERLTPQFTLLENVFNKRQVEIQSSNTGVTPEQVLVMEIIGSVADFVNAVSKVEGFEWLCEFASDEIEPDADFFVANSESKPLAGRLFMIMSNTEALSRMLSLWKKWEKDPKCALPYGLARFKEIFAKLKTIRKWDVKDRLLETNVLQAWREDLQYGGDEYRRFEIELWYRESVDDRQAHQEQVERIVREAGGVVHHSYTLESIAYHGILAELPIKEIQKIINNEHIELVKCESIFLFWPVGQAINEDFTHDADPQGSTNENDREIVPPPSGDPEIAILDGLPLANHKYLANRLTIDDPDDWSADYPAANRQHGTAMASLVVNGDLNLHLPPLRTPVYVTPIMKPNKNTSNNVESIPDTHIFIDTIHRAVKRMFEGDKIEGPKASNVKIINLSIGDRYRPFLRSLSPLARLLDWLSYKYNVLFLVSAGNHLDSICFGEKVDFEKLEPHERQDLIIKTLYGNLLHRRIFSPAESINALTIGAVHLDHAEEGQLQKHALNPFTKILPSLISPFGGGYRNAIKPDVIYNGGKQVVNQHAPSDKVFLVNTSGPPGIKVAAPGSIAGRLDATKHCIGTSNATGLLSHAGGKYLEILKEILIGNHEYDSAYTAVLIKAMLAHSASWGDGAEHLKSVFQDEHGTKKSKELISKWFGYGIPALDRVMNCTSERATLIGYGELLDGRAHRFELPLPSALESTKHLRRLIVTLAWISPISPKSYMYRNAKMWLKLPSNMPLFNSTNEVSVKASERGTLQHLIYEGDHAATYSKGNTLSIDVNCVSEAGEIQQPVRYGLFVTLEAAEGVAIYDEIRALITTRVSIQQRA